MRVGKLWCSYMAMLGKAPYMAGVRGLRIYGVGVGSLHIWLFGVVLVGVWERLIMGSLYRVVRCCECLGVALLYMVGVMGSICEDE